MAEAVFSAFVLIVSFGLVFLAVAVEVFGD